MLFSDMTIKTPIFLVITNGLAVISRVNDDVLEINDLQQWRPAKAKNIGELMKSGTTIKMLGEEENVFIAYKENEAHVVKQGKDFVEIKNLTNGEWKPSRTTTIEALKEKGFKIERC